MTRRKAPIVYRCTNPPEELRAAMQSDRVTRILGQALARVLWEESEPAAEERESA